MPHWGRFSGFLSYSNQSAIGEGPFTGGLFIGAEAGDALAATDRFAVSQDQRNTLRTRVRFQAERRLWLAFAAAYGSGLPVELEGDSVDLDFLLSQYGPAVLDRVNFNRGRVRPVFSLDAALGADVFRKERRSVSLLAQVGNLTDHLNVLNFASLFSGTAIAAPRSFSVRLRATF